MGADAAGPGDLSGDGVPDVVDGDEHADFVVADYWADSSGGAEGGRVQVYSGFTGALLRVLDGIEDYE